MMEPITNHSAFLEGLQEGALLSKETNATEEQSKKFLNEEIQIEPVFFREDLDTVLQKVTVMMKVIRKEPSWKSADLLPLKTWRAKMQRFKSSVDFHAITPEDCTQLNGLLNEFAAFEAVNF